MTDWLPLLSFFPFCAADWGLAALGVTSPYYLLHALHNAAVVALTWSDVVATFTDFHALDSYPVNMPAVALVVALHAYHVARYRSSLRYDDVLHHVLMIGVAIPLGLFASAVTPLMGYSLFFATGLPGGISYAALFLQRNGWLGRLAEKRVNTAMNVWVRAPGCASHAALTLAWLASSSSTPSPLHAVLGLAPAVLMYWNGQYFMKQAVADLARRELEDVQHQV